MEKNLSIEAFNVLDHFFSGLIPQVELEEGSSTAGGNFVWVCSYGGMNFFRRMTIVELFEQQINKLTSLN